MGTEIANRPIINKQKQKKKATNRFITACEISKITFFFSQETDNRYLILYYLSRTPSDIFEAY